MNKIEAEYHATMVLDSINVETNTRLSTIHMRLPWYITPELLRHRAFSFSSRSTRATPSSVMLKQVRENPCLPLSWGKNQKGMQSSKDFTYPQQVIIEAEIFDHAAHCVEVVEQLDKMGVHKQNANKYLMPFLWCDILVSSTTWANFLALRTDPAAAPEMQVIARLTADALVESKPELMYPGQWHMPYVNEAQCVAETGWPTPTWQDRRMLEASAARCARLSIRNFDEDREDWEKDLATAKKLQVSRPVHASPFEHVAQARDSSDTRTSNFDAGWAQLRQMLPHQVATEFEWKGQIIK